MEGLVLMETSNTYRADSAPAHGGHHLVDGLMRCDACWGVCLPQWRCRCCLTTEIEALRARVQEMSQQAYTSISHALAEERAEKAEAEVEALIERIEQLRAQVQAVRELHQPTPGFNGSHWCAAGCENTVDGDPTEWPCSTIRALDGTDE
jgi:hypothetical protein